MPSSRVRVLNLLPYLKGLEFKVAPYPQNIWERFKLFKSLRSFDLVFLQKKMPTVFEAFLLRKCSKKLIFDFDDAIYVRHDGKESFTRKARFESIAKRSDLIIAGNRILAEEARKYNKNVAILPSAVRVSNIPIKNYEFKNDRLIIGWIGTAINLPHLKLVEPVLIKLSEEFPIELRIISSKSIEMKGIHVTFINWSLETQEEEISKFDVGIMPLPNDLYTKGKCGYKALQYMACCIPPVVSDVGVNSEIVRHGIDGFVAKDEGDFYLYLKLLLKNENLRREMGLNARKRAEENYSIEVISKRLLELLLA
jgi:glycosyltransferase involved in cell wall biosynthesis